MSSKPAVGPSQRQNQYFKFLRRLRAGGRSNMYGAIPYLAAAFGCDRTTAFEVVCQWIDTQDAELDASSTRKKSVLI